MCPQRSSSERHDNRHGTHSMGRSVAPGAVHVGLPEFRILEDICTICMVNICHMRCISQHCSGSLHNAPRHAASCVYCTQCPCLSGYRHVCISHRTRMSLIATAPVVVVGICSVQHSSLWLGAQTALQWALHAALHVSSAASQIGGLGCTYCTSKQPISGKCCP
jgi:hypothetical protein